MRPFQNGDRVWVLNDDGEIVKGTIILITDETYNREHPTHPIYIKVRIFMIECDKTGTWPIGEDRVRLMSPLDRLAEV